MRINVHEVWKDVKGYEGFYKISNFGNVKSLSYNGTGKERVLKKRDTGDGHFAVILYKNKSHKKHFIHRLVAEAFIPNPKALDAVHHINENPGDNRADNLEWISFGEHSSRHLKNNKRGEGHGIPVRCILTGKVYKTAREASRKTGVSPVLICRCCKGKTKSTMLKDKRKTAWEYA